MKLPVVIAFVVSEHKAYKSIYLSTVYICMVFFGIKINSATSFDVISVCTDNNFDLSLKNH